MVGQKGIPCQFGGIERHVEALAVRLGKAGHEVLVYTRAWYSDTSGHYAEGVRTVVTPTVRTKHLDAIVHTLTSTVHAMREGVDVIHFHGVGPSLLSWLPRVFTPRIRVVSTFHCVDSRHQKWGAFARTMLTVGEFCACRFPHRTIAVSRTLQDYCSKRYGREVDYIPNGIEEPACGVGHNETLDRFGLTTDGYIVMVSRLVRHKGAHYLIDAYRRLASNSRTAGRKLVIVGGSAHTDDYVAELKAKADGHPDIVFTDYQSGEALSHLFANAYLVVHPSESEGLPISVLEAMSYGKTVVASDIPEMLEVTDRHGISFRTGDTFELSVVLESLLHNPRLVSRKGEEARVFVLENYHWDSVVHSVDEVYRSLAPMAQEATT